MQLIFITKENDKMEKPDNWDDIEAITTKKPEPDFYILKIINAIEGTTKNGEAVLKLELDIIEGEFENYFTDLSSKLGKNLLLRSNQLIKRPAALPFFKKLINDVQDSNIGFNFDFNPMSLKGKKIGAELELYIYESKFGDKEGLRISRFFTVGEVRKKLAKKPPENFENVFLKRNDDLPFD